MTKSNTEIILDAAAIAEIEELARKRPHQAEVWKIDALIQTVRALKQIGLHNAQLVDRIRTWSRCEDGYPLDEHINNIAADRERLKAENKEYERRWRNQTQRNYSLSQANRDLQSQLDQITKELAEEKRLRVELKEIAQTGIAEVSSVGTVLRDNALTDFRLRAVQLCRDKVTHAPRCQSRFENLRLPCDCPARYYEDLAVELEQLK